MGMVNPNPKKKLHAEARRESFVIYTDFGDQRMELSWDKLVALDEHLKWLKNHAEQNNLIEKAAKAKKE